MKSRIPASLRVIGRSFVDWWDNWVDLVLVVTVWMLAQLTVVLGPPATFGVYYVIFEMMNGTALGVRGLIQGAKKYFWPALLWGVINLAAVGVFLLNYWFYNQIAQTATWGFYAQVFVSLIGLLYVGALFYALPFYFYQERKSLKMAYRNGLFTFLAAPFFSFFLLLLSIIFAVLSAIFVLPIFLGIPMLIPIFGYRALYNRLETFGLREREKTPKEIEAENGRIRIVGSNLSMRDAAAGKAIAHGEGHVEKDSED
jgi:hypothetical protein